MTATEPGALTRKRYLAPLRVVPIRILSVAAGLAYIKSYTGAMSTEEVGMFFYLSTLSYALSALVFVPADYYMQARIAALPAVPLDGIRRLIALTLVIGAVACLLLGIPMVVAGKLRSADLLLLYVVAALLYLCMSLRNLLNNRDGMTFASLMLLVESLGRLGAFLIVAAVVGASARTLMASSAAALGVELALILDRMRRSLRFDVALSSLDRGSAILRVAAPISGSALCNAVQLQAFRVAYPLAGLGSTSGMYGVVSNIGQQAMAACGSILAQIETPRLYRSGGESIRRYVSLALLLAAGVLLSAVVLAPFAVRLLTKADYLPYAYVIAFGVVIEGCNLIIGGYAVLLSLQRRTGMLLKFNLVAATASIIGVLSAMAYRPGDPFAIGWAVAGSQLLMVIALFTLVSQQDGKGP